MKIIKTCKECKTSKFIGFECDFCNKEMNYDSITITFGYEHSLDGEEHHFCSDKCAKEFFGILIYEDEKEKQLKEEEQRTETLILSDELSKLFKKELYIRKIKYLFKVDTSGIDAKTGKTWTMTPRKLKTSIKYIGSKMKSTLSEIINNIIEELSKEIRDNEKLIIKNDSFIATPLMCTPPAKELKEVSKEDDNTLCMYDPDTFERKIYDITNIETHRNLLLWYTII